MKTWAKAGLIGFVIAFIGLWIILFTVGHDSNGWKCQTLSGTDYCSFFKFLVTPMHWVFVLFFSWVGFFGGVIDSKIINKVIYSHGKEKLIPLRITSIILMTAIAVFALIGLLAFDNWSQIILYSVIFGVFVYALNKLIEWWKYS